MIDHHHPGEVFFGVEGKLLVERHVGGDLKIVQQERVAVGCRLRDPVGANQGAAARDIFDNHVLLDNLRHGLGHDPRRLIGGTTGGIGHDDRHRAAGILTRM